MVTNAHVIAGQDDTRLIPPSGPSVAAEPVYVDAGNDVAVLRADDLDLRALRLGDAPDAAESVVLLGYPNGGALVAEAATAAAPRTVFTQDAYGDGAGGAQRGGHPRHPGAGLERRPGRGPRRRGGGDDLRRLRATATRAPPSRRARSAAASSRPLRPVDSGPCA